MRTYEEIVERSRKMRQPRMIANGSISHARVIFDNLLTVAIEEKSDLKIVTGTLRRDFYNEFSEKICTLLESNSVSVILVQCDFDQLADNSFYDAIRKSPRGKFFEADVDSSFNHFMLVGNSAYRFEKDHDRGVAVANFCDNSVGSWLAQMFADILELATPLSYEHSANNNQEVVVST